MATRKMVELVLDSCDMLEVTLEWVILRLMKEKYHQDVGKEIDRYKLFLELCKKISKVDREAGDWLLNGGFGWLSKRRFAFTSNLSGLFTWGDSPQGHDYWSAINSKICG